MTKLSLKSTDPAHDVSIRLRPGQFCTLGSSSASDYCVRAAGILPVHCRISCRSNGGFIECFDPSAVINIAGTDKNRSRLTNGDLLKIGSLGIEVVIPQVENPAAQFELTFDDIASTESGDAPTAPPSEAHFFDETTIDSPAKKQLHAPEVSRQPPIDQPEPQAPSSDSIPTQEPASFAAGSASENKHPTVANSDRETEGEKATSPDDGSKSHKTAESSKPVFEFDSVEPGDIKLTEQDLDAIENMTGNSLVLQDFDAMMTETFPDHIRHQQSAPNESTAPQPPSTGSDSENLVPHGSDSGKCYHWTGKTVLPTVELLEQRISELQCFEIQENVNLVSCSFADIKRAVARQDSPKIFVLTQNPLHELNSFFTVKPWNERLGHPRALSMFLTLLPAKNIKRMFAQIDACILIQSSELELVRLNPNLEK